MFLYRSVTCDSSSTIVIAAGTSVLAHMLARHPRISLLQPGADKNNEGMSLNDVWCGVVIVDASS